MPHDLILASASEIRQTLLRNAGLVFTAMDARIDEDMARARFLAEATTPRDIADALAEMKARKISRKYPRALVIGCDQVLNLAGEILSKPTSPEEAHAQLSRMRGKRHDLISAVVVCKDGNPLWRHLGVVQMTMRKFSNTYLNEYIARNWHSVRDSVGAYKLEEEGVRLFSRVEGDYFTVLGLPLLSLLTYLDTCGELEQ